MRLALLLFLLTAGIQEPTNTGRIEGSVTTLDSAAPIPNAVVIAREDAGRELRTISDASGHYSFQSVPAGRYFVFTDRAGYARPYNGGYSKSLKITSGGPPGRADLTLVRAGLIKGRVTDRNGAPVANASVVAEPTTYSGGQILLRVSTSFGRPGAWTNANGEYEIPSVTPMEYYIFADGTYYPNAVDPSNGKAVMVGYGKEVIADIEVQPVVRFKVSGDVRIELPGGGIHSLTNLYLVKRDIRVRDDVPPDAISSPSRISSGEPTPDINLPTTFPTERRFEMGDVRPGHYDLFAVVTTTSGEGPTQRYSRSMGRTPIEVVNGNIDNATVVVRPGVTVTGNVQFRLTPIGTTPNLPWMFESLMAASGSQDGKFRMDNVPPGTYAADFDSSDKRAVDVLQNGISIYESGLLVGTTSPDPIEVIPLRESGTLGGTVQSSDPRGAQYAWVTLAPPAGQRENLRRFRGGRADATGRFAITSIPPGDYRLFVFGEIPYNATANARFLSSYESFGVPVTINAGQSLTINPAVIPIH